MVIYPPASPDLFTVSMFTIKWYGFLITLAVVGSYLLILKEVKKQKIDESKLDSVFLITILLGVIGARLGYVLQNMSDFFSQPLAIIKVWDGGLSIHGAIILGATGLYLASRRYKINFLNLANIFAPFLMISGAIGRWGNYFNQEIIGKPSAAVIRLYVSESNRPVGYEENQYFHPVFLYESVLLALGFAVYLIFKKRIADKALIYTLIYYSLVRIIVEFWRIDYRPIFMHFDLAQWVSFGIIVVSGVIGLTFRKK